MKQGLILFFTLWLFSLHGTAYYVSPNGNDRNKGTKWVMPFKTLQKAASIARAGDTVNIMKGDYYSNEMSLLHIETSGAENGWIVYKNYYNHKPVLHVRNKYGIWIQSANYISLEGLTISPEKKSDDTSLAIVKTGIFIDGNYTSPCTHIKIFNNFIENLTGSGLYADYFDYLTISFNKFFNNASASEAAAGIYLKDAVDLDGRSVYHNFIQGNVLEKNGVASKNFNACHPAVYLEYKMNYLSSPDSKTLIHNNLLYTNGGGGIGIHGAMGINIVNNTLYKNSEMDTCHSPEIEIANSSMLNVFNNIFYSSAAKPGNGIKNSADIHFKNNLFYNYSYLEHGENELIANPQFEMTNDKEGTFNFRLKGNSPAINAGVDELLSDIDFEGNKRKVDTHVDLGALEFTNRIMPSLKHTKAGPQTKGLKSYWSSLFTKDQKVYTIWNQQNEGFSIRVFDYQGNRIIEKIREDSGESAFEIDFNNYPPGFYTIYAFNGTSKHLERINVQNKMVPQ